MSLDNQPPEQAVATLPVLKTLGAAFPTAYGHPGLLLRAAAGGLLLIAATAAIFLAAPSGLTLLLFLLSPLVAYCHFGVNWYRVVLLGPEGLVRPTLRWDRRHWRVLAYAAGINLATLMVQFPLTLAFPPLASLIALAVFYVTARLSFIFPALAVEEAYTLALSWRHTAGQGLRLATALLIAGLPPYLGITVIIEELFHALVGVSMADIAAAGSGNSDTLGNLLSQVSPASVITVIVVFDVLVMAVLAVQFTIVALAFHTCTGWVPAGPTTVARVFGEDDDDDRDGDDRGGNDRNGGGEDRGPRP